MPSTGSGSAPAIDESPPADARRWLTGQFDRFEARPAPIAALPSRTVVAELADYLEEFRRAGLSDDEPPRRQRRPQAGHDAADGGARHGDPG